jgi:hypothetical protein
MIAEALIRIGVGFVNFILGLLPDAGPPAWMQDGGVLSSIWQYGAGLGAWIPWPIVGTVLAAVFACMVAGFVIKVVRIIASFATVGGGSAG